MKIKSLNPIINRLLIPFFFISLCSLSCSSYKSNIEKWEGISDTLLKVTISEFFPFEENQTNDSLKQQIRERLDQRASLLMASHLSINLTRSKVTHETDLAINNLIIETIKHGVVLNFECSENNYCTAEGEYNIIELQKKLESINNL